MRMNSTKFYIVSLGVIIASCFYPIYMGINTIRIYLKVGYLELDNLYQYMIPYTPIAISLILSIIIMPILYKLLKKYTLLGMSVVAILIFLIAEMQFEKIPVGVPDASQPLESWQLYQCSSFSFVQRVYEEVMFAPNNPGFKIHYDIISIVIILIVINVVFGIFRMIKEENCEKKAPIVTQLISGIIFIGLCILACCTAFFRDGYQQVSPISAILMSIFFIVYGITGGIYIGCIFFGKRKVLSRIMPSIVASLVTLIMYIGELTLMEGILYIYGKGLLFEPVPNIAFAPIDIIIIVLPGMFTYLILTLLNRKNTQQHIDNKSLKSK